MKCQVVVGVETRFVAAIPWRLGNQLPRSRPPEHPCEGKWCEASRFSHFLPHLGETRRPYLGL